MKKILAIAVLAAGVILSAQAFAHGAKPRHGGIVQTAGDLSFELVAGDGGATIYVDDHGKGKATAGATGTLTVLKGTHKFELPLASSGNNTLAVKGQANLDKGSKAVAAVTFADKKIVNVRFSVK